MPWVRIDDSLYEHPKILRAGLPAMGLFIAGLCYCNRHLTDGLIPTEAVRVLGGTPKLVKALVDNNLWSECEGGYQVHDFLEYQPARSQVLGERTKAAERMARVRANNPRTSPEVPATFGTSSGVGSPYPNPVPSQSNQQPKKVVTRTTEIDDEFVLEMVARFAHVLGGRAGILERIEEAKGHKAWTGWTDKQAGVRGWLRRDAERALSGNGVAHRPAVRTSEDVEIDNALIDGLRSGRIKDGEPVKLGDLLRAKQVGASHG